MPARIMNGIREANATTGTTTRLASERHRSGDPAALDPQHGEAGVLFKDLEAATRSRLNYHGLTDGLNALIQDGAATRVSEKPARLRITNIGRAHLNEY